MLALSHYFSLLLPGQHDIRFCTIVTYSYRRKNNRTYYTQLRPPEGFCHGFYSKTIIYVYVFSIWKYISVIIYLIAGINNYFLQGVDIINITVWASWFD